MAIEFLFIGTEDFFKKWNSCPPKKKLKKHRDYSDDLWTKFIENGSGSFVGDFRISNKQIPMNSSSMLSSRLRHARDWCRRNWNDIQEPDAVAVVDYFNQNDAQGSRTPPGNSLSGTAGSKSCICISNLYDADHNDLMAPYASVGGEGVVHHEIGHLFDADHPQDVSAKSNGDASQMYSPTDGIGCTDSPNSPIVVSRWHGRCAKQTIQQYINTQNSLP